MNIADRHHRLSLGALASNKQDALAMNERSLLDRSTSTEPKDLRLRLQRNHLRRFVLRVEHQKVLLHLPLSNPCLRRGIGLKASMPIQVIRRNVQNHRNPRMKLLHRLQLEARHLEHTNGLWPTLRHQ